MSDVHIEKDNVAKDLAQIIAKTLPNLPLDKITPLMEQLVMYTATRDHKIWDHAYKLGKESANAKKQ
jgi:hypothetical protein